MFSSGVDCVMFSRALCASLLIWGAVSGPIRHCAALPLPHYEEPGVLTASIYARGTSTPRLLYNFRRTAARSGSQTTVLREYTYPDGKLAARERVVYDGKSLRSYHLDELQTESWGTATLLRDPHDPARTLLTIEYAKDGGSRAHSRTEVLNAGALVNDMMGDFISSNVERVQTGAKVNCRYIVVSRKETVGLSLSKDGETTWHGQAAIILKLQPASPLISVLVDPLYFAVEKAAPHRVFQYVGRTTPKGGSPGHWKDLDAVTVFNW
jgi:hypothetical protein